MTGNLEFKGLIDKSVAQDERRRSHMVFNFMHDYAEHIVSEQCEKMNAINLVLSSNSCNTIKLLNSVVINGSVSCFPL